MNMRNPRLLKIIARATMAIYTDVQTIKQEMKIMTTQNDLLIDAVSILTAKVADLGDAVVDHDTKIQAELTALQTAVDGSAAKDDPNVARVIGAISQASATVARTSETIKAESAALAASLLPKVTELPAQPSPVDGPAPVDPTTGPAV